MQTTAQGITALQVYAFLGAVLTITNIIITFRKANNDPILRQLDEQKREFREAVDRIEVELNANIEARINAWSTRITDNRDNLRSLEGRMMTQEQEMVRRQEVEKAAASRQSEINGKIDTLASQVGGIEGRLSNRMNDLATHIVERVVKSLNGHK